MAEDATTGRPLITYEDTIQRLMSGQGIPRVEAEQLFTYIVMHDYYETWS